MSRLARDPRQALVRLVARLELRSAFVTLTDIQRAVACRPRSSLPVAGLDELIVASVAEQLLLTDRRTFFRRKDVTFEEVDVFRVNRRHPLARGQLL